jgi:hemerythrin-like domain-containing protein
VRATGTPLHRCDRCDRVYWAGTHVQAMRALIDELREVPLVRGRVEDAAPAGTELLTTLQPLVDLHQAIDLLLLDHRLALMDADPRRALATFRRFAIALRRHLDLEDDLALPRYREAGPFERGAAPELFAREHEKILAQLVALDDATEALGHPGLGDPERRVACLELLDREKVFADLLEHHDLRERQFLYPALERSLGEHEKVDLLERMTGSSPANPR